MMPFKRLKTLSFALFTALSLWTAPVLAAGTLPLAMAQQIDINGRPLANCQLTFYVAGTVGTLQDNFADFGLTQKQANPLNCDQAGRVPMFWLADGLIHIRLTDSTGGLGGTPVIDTTMQVLGPSSGGGGGGGTVDPTSIMATGDMKLRYGIGPLAGFVRLNGLTIGTATSGATERANADTQALWVYLYGDATLPVSGGRTGNALNDFNANKTIGLPDWRGQAVAALDDMGNSPSGRLTATYFGVAATTLGASGGSQSQTLTLAELPSGITSANGSQSISVTSAIVNVLNGNLNNGVVAGAGTLSAPTTVTAGASAIVSAGNNSIAVTSNNTGGAQTPTVMPAKLTTIYMKL